MLRKLKIWIFNNWFIIFSAALVSFMFYRNNIFLFFIALFIFWYKLGFFFKAFYFAFIFLPALFFLKHIDSQILYVVSKSFLNNILTAILFLIIIFYLQKKEFVNLLIYFCSLLTALLLYHLNIFGLVGFLYFSVFISILFARFFLNYSLLNSLILGLIIFEGIFIYSFLPFNFLTRNAILLLFLLIMLKFNIVLRYGSK
ncbi:MAG: hypothetical protein KatS3mg097_166 [Candidatus Parcubacteria bacterium]|nr:MAG: hypothetical protein KatS3mg097_166 [Candidatus Parcubacteria bacterium]